MTDNDQDKGTNEAYSLGRLSASIGYINRSIDQINDNVQDLNTKIDKLSTTFAKEMECMKVDVTRHTVELDTKVKFLIMGISAACSAIVTVVTTLVIRIFTLK